MAKYTVEEVAYSVDGAHVGIVAARFNHEIVNTLLDAALATLHDKGIARDAITVAQVPGAFELALGAQRLAERRGTEAVIALGAVINGETKHGDYVCAECASGLTRVSLDTGLPVIFGVLTTYTAEQAWARAGGDHGNKGHEAALAALEMITLLRHLKSDG